MRYTNYITVRITERQLKNLMATIKKEKSNLSTILRDALNKRLDLKKGMKHKKK
jgi:hypothetical protein